MQNRPPWGGINQFFEVRPPHQCATLPVDLDQDLLEECPWTGTTTIIGGGENIEIPPHDARGTTYK
jgi:hypothetical protein